MGERNEYLLLVVGGWAGVSQTGFCMNAAFSLVSPQPTLFIIASTLAFYGANPFCFLVTVLQFMHMIYPPVCSVKCLHVSVIHVSLLCHLCFPSSPCPIDSFTEISKCLIFLPTFTMPQLQSTLYYSSIIFNINSFLIRLFEDPHFLYISLFVSLFE